jgi:RNA polymerase sigma-70 factor (ECF subfamily)
MRQRPNKIDACLPQAQAGSQAALGDVLEASRRYLLWVARRELDPTLQAKAGASDLVQETLLEANRDFGQFHGNTEAEFLAWLRRLLLNNLANFARSYRATAKRRLDLEQPLDAGEGERAARLAGKAATPSVELMAQERSAAVQKALDRLPEDYRQVLTLWQQEDRTFEEIGKVMHRSANAARMLWLRALERLQQELDVA